MNNMNEDLIEVVQGGVTKAKLQLKQAVKRN